MRMQESSNGCSIDSFILSRSAVRFRHENNNYISRRVVRFRCLRARAGCHEGDRDFGAEIREPGYWHGHVHKDWRRSARRCRRPKPQTGQARYPHSRERRLRPPTSHPAHQHHDGPTGTERHAGDFGNIEADASGKGHLKWKGKLDLSGPNSIIGKSVIVHEKEDDLKTDPAGNSGARFACGVINAAD